MIRKTTALLGAGMLIAGLAAPLTASADADDNALAFIIGAAVGQAIDGDEVRFVHRRGHHGARHLRRFHHPAHSRAHYTWRHGDRWDRRWHRLERRHDRHERRHERREWRHERREDRHERRHERRDDRHDRRHERRFHD